MTYYNILNRKVDYYITKYETDTSKHTFNLDANTLYKVKAVGSGGGCCNYTGSLGGAISTTAVGGGSGAYIELQIRLKSASILSFMPGTGGASKYSSTTGSATPGQPGTTTTLDITDATTARTLVSFTLGGGKGGTGSVYSNAGGRGGIVSRTSFDESAFSLFNQYIISDAAPGSALGAVSPYMNTVGRGVVGAGGGTTTPSSSSAANRYDGGNGACSIIDTVGVGTYLYSENECSAVNKGEMYYILER